MLRLVVFAVSIVLSSAAFAQTATPQSPVAPPAQSRPEVTPEQRAEFRSALDSCRAEVKPANLPRGERRTAMRKCMEAKNPSLAPVFARGEARRAEMRQVRDACRSEVRGRNIRGPERREAIKSCVVAKKPEMAKVFSCVDQAKAKNLQPGQERRAFMQTCIRT
jgi:psiF repeat